MQTKKAKIKYKFDTYSDANLMPLSIFKILFLKATMEQLVKCHNKILILHTYNEMSITQSGVYTVTMRHKNKDNFADST